MFGRSPGAEPPLLPSAGTRRLDFRLPMTYHDSMKLHGYFRVAAAAPSVRPAAIVRNTDSIIHAYFQASEAGADLVLFPELALSGYTCGDLFYQSRLLDEVEAQIARLIDETSARGTLSVIGMPLQRRGRLYNVAVVISGGNRILGVVPKTYIPHSREFYENRWFASADEADFDTTVLAGQSVPFGSDILFQHEEDPLSAFAVEICEDLWAPIPPSSYHALLGAQMIFNLSASNELVGKADYRRDLITGQSARLFAGYAYASCGCGESTTDTVYGGHTLIAENGRIIAEGERFERGTCLTLGDLDLQLLDHERRISRTFGFACRETKGRTRRVVGFSGRLRGNSESYPPLRPVDPYPFVPSDPVERQKRCSEIAFIQATGLATRMNHAGIRSLVIGLSGGLDSTLALLVCIQALELLSLPRQEICALTMPGFGTTERTLGNVKKLCGGFGITLETIDIREGCRQHMKQLGHSGEPKDVAYENIQARYRTALLMNKANMNGGLVVGTGDMSELALGWATYNGDHMSMYAVNSGVPKTLVRYMVDWAAETWSPQPVKQVLADILDTPISPELLPPDESGAIRQKTEDSIGAYELHDFFLFHVMRHGFGPLKILNLARRAFDGRHNDREIHKWLEVFYRRFFSQQFKRSCMPDGPKVGSIALSPRGDWRMPSDAEASIWLAKLKELNTQAGK